MKHCRLLIGLLVGLSPMMGCTNEAKQGYQNPALSSSIEQDNQQWLAQWQARDLEEGAEIIEIEEPEILPKTYYAAGQLFEAKGEFNKAIQLYRNTLEEKPDYILAYNRIGVCLNRLRQYHQAERIFQQAIQLRPDLSFLHNNLGFCNMLQRRWSEAEQCFLRALKLNPKYARAQANLAIVLSHQDRFDEAFVHLKASQGAPKAYYNLGLLYKARGRMKEAAVAFERALELEPQFVFAQIQLDRITSISARTSPMIEAPVASSDPVTSPTHIDPVFYLQEDGEQIASTATAEASIPSQPTDEVIVDREGIYEVPCSDDRLDALVSELAVELKPCLEHETLDQAIMAATDYQRSPDRNVSARGFMNDEPIWVDMTVPLFASWVMSNHWPSDAKLHYMLLEHQWQFRHKVAASWMNAKDWWKEHTERARDGGRREQDKGLQEHSKLSKRHQRLEALLISDADQYKLDTSPLGDSELRESQALASPR